METIKFFLVMSGIIIAKGEGETVSQEPLGQKIEFKSPEMSDEEQHSTHLPIEFKCDACTAISYQMTLALNKAEKSGKRLKESEYLDVFEKVCSLTTWDNYGLKSVNGVNRISGKGLEAEDVPGMMYGGGKWPMRLMSRCMALTGEIGEDEIYDAFRDTGDLKKFLCTESSQDCVVNTKHKKMEL